MPDFGIHKYISNENKELITTFYHEMETYFCNINETRPYMTDHGKRHIQNVMENAYMLLESDPFKLHEKDYVYLMQSICVHDLAMGNFKFSDRNDHHLKIYEVLDEIMERNETLRTNIKGDKYIICKIAAAHSGPHAKSAYDKIYDDSSISSDVDPKVLFLAMLLRIADELDITQERIRGQPLSNKLPAMEAVSQMHWIKHESIIKCRISKEDNYSCLTLFLKHDMPEELIKYKEEYKLKFSDDEYMEFMCKSISKLQYELETVFNYCAGLKEGSNWKLKKVALKNADDHYNDTSGYIEKLNKMITENKYIAKPDKDKEIKAYDFDSAVKENNEKKEKATEINLNHPKNDSKSGFIPIGADKYRTKIDRYIKKHYMLKKGCYEHKGLRILSWLDSFGFHQYLFFINLTSNIMVKDIKERIPKDQDIDFIIGLGLKGAKIASVIGLKLEKPVYFYLNNDIMINKDRRDKPYKIIMITDCVITGKSANDCMAKLSNLNCKLIGVYSVFIRNHIQNDKNRNELIKKEIPVYTINHTFSFATCPIEKQEDCPLYILNGNKCNKQTNKQ